MRGFRALVWMNKDKKQDKLSKVVYVGQSCLRLNNVKEIDYGNFQQERQGNVKELDGKN